MQQGTAVARPAARLSAAPGKTPAAARLRVAMATPLGANGRGGMDRLADLVISRLNGEEGAARASVVRLTTKGGRGRIWGAFVFLAAAVQLVTLLLRGRIDVLHVNLAAYGSFHRKRILVAIARWFGVAYIVHIHTGRFATFWSEAGRRRAHAIDEMMRGSAGVVVLGRVFEQMVLDRLPDIAGKVTVLANATPARAPRNGTGKSGGKVHITFLGILCAQKGVPQLVEALGQLEEHGAWAATLAGSGDRAGMMRLADELGIGGRVDMPGWIDAKAVDDLLAKTDILVLPSFSEGLPMVIVEAFAAGIPVVATPINAILDVVRNGENGLLVEPGDVPGLAAALRRMIDDDALRREMGATALKDHREKYDPTPYLQRLVELWSNAARGGGRAGPG